ncbi:MAG: matrixin family metalloprotease, partial [Gemmataceae bacterium]
MTSKKTVQRSALRLENLEDRTTPASFGRPWVHNNSITLSFVPDGTLVDGVPSNLNAAMNGDGLSTSTWQREVLRAVQSWIGDLDADVGVVSDSGAPIGSTGRTQGDIRFGDIRIAGRSLGNGLLAITTPPGEQNETRSGDIIINTDYVFSNTNDDDDDAPAARDLYTVMLQEVGHALGIPSNGDPTSAMYYYYQGARTDLSTNDWYSAEELYGSRQARSESLRTPANNSINRFVDAAILNSTDTDTFTFTTPSSIRNDARLELRTNGLSLLTGRLSVRNSNGTTILSNSTTLPGQNVSLPLASLSPNTTYTFRVAPNTTTGYQTGRYQVALIWDTAAGDPVPPKATTTYIADNGSNFSLSSAISLPNVSSGTTS